MCADLRAARRTLSIDRFRAFVSFLTAEAARDFVHGGVLAMCHRLDTARHSTHLVTVRFPVRLTAVLAESRPHLAAVRMGPIREDRAAPFTVNPTGPQPEGVTDLFVLRTLLGRQAPPRRVVRGAWSVQSRTI